MSRLSVIKMSTVGECTLNFVRVSSPYFRFSLLTFPSQALPNQPSTHSSMMKLI